MFLQAYRISKRYRVGSSYSHALRETSLSFPRVGMVGIVGPSGSGKTTLLNLLSGLDKPSSGNVLFQNKEVRKGQDCALVFQHYNLIDGATVYQNVSLPCSIQGLSHIWKRVVKALQAVGLSRLAGRNVDTLSGGEKQRVAIARAIVTQPAYLCADEPTGALDAETAESIMKLLKQISKEILVIFVSHNLDFVNRYADMIVSVKEGKTKIVKHMEWKEETIQSKERKHGHRWFLFFFRRNLKRHILKNGACLLSGTIGFLSLLLTIGFYGGHEAALEREGKRLLHYQSAYLSEKERVEIPNSPLTLVRETRPSLLTATDLTEGIYGLSFETDLSYFFPASLPYELLGEKQEPVRFTPIFDITLREGNTGLLAQGSLPIQNDLNTVLVNAEFAAMFPSSVIGKKIHVEAKSQISRLDATETVFLSFDLVISGVVEEFSFLNAPRVYYSYQGLWNHLSDYELEAFNKVGRTRYTVIDFLNDSPTDSPYLQYRYLVYSHDFAETEKLLKKIPSLEEGSFTLESEAYTIQTSFASIAEAFASSLALVSGISLVGLLAITMMMAYSSFTEKKKEAAVLLSLGAIDEDLTSIFALESLFVTALAMVVALLLALPLIRFGNDYLKQNFGLADIMVLPWEVGGLAPWMIGVIFLFGAALFGFLCGALPILFSKRIPLAEELRDE